MTLRPRIRKAVTLFHLWFGLGLGLYFAVIGLTGSFLVFRSDVEERAMPELVRVAALPGAKFVPVSALVASVKKRFPGADDATLRSLTWPRYPGGAYELTVDGKSVTVSPYTGDVLREIDLSRNPIEIIRSLHTELLWPAKGMLLNTYGGLLLTLLLLSGLWIWWPKTFRQLRARVTIKWRVSLKRTMLDLHNVFGSLGLAVLLMFCITGAVFGVWQTAHDNLYRLLGQIKPLPVPTSVVVPPGGRALPYDVLVADVESDMPGAHLEALTYPTKADTPITAYGALDDGHSAYISLALDPYTGRLLQREDAREVPTAGITMRWIHFMHLGQWGGWTVKIVYSLFGLLPTGLFVTGGGRWFLRKRGQRAVTASPSVAPNER